MSSPNAVASSTPAPGAAGQGAGQVPGALDDVAGQLVASYLGDERARRISHRYLPSREAIVEILERVLDLMYPGYFGRRDLNKENLAAFTAQAVYALGPKIEQEMEHCLCYGREREAVRPDIGDCAPRARELSQVFLRRLPEIRQLLLRDVQAAFDGDPAATNLDEVVLAYPGLLAVSVYRIAHALYDLGVPMMARIMTEWAHSKTGCDIHPGAKIGAAFFIDHATGVVIGETTEIGDGVKLYQGVTLGALSFPRDATGQIIRGRKRHPTVEAGSTLYANANRSRRTDGGRLGQRHRWFGIPDAHRSRTVARLAEGTGTAGGNAGRCRRAGCDLLRYIVT